MSAMGQYVSTAEAAARLSTSPRQVRRWCLSGALKAEKVGDRAWIIDAASVEALRAKRERRGGMYDPLTLKLVDVHGLTLEQAKAKAPAYRLDTSSYDALFAQTNKLFGKYCGYIPTYSADGKVWYAYPVMERIDYDAPHCSCIAEMLWDLSHPAA